MKRFIKDVKKYIKYTLYATKSELKAEVANSYLNWLWWLLDPICFMLTYTFIVEIVFQTSEPYFPVFVFVGLTVWNFFNKVVALSVKLVNSNKAIVTKVYLPKYILLFVKISVNAFKMFISWGLVFVLMIIFKVPYTLNILTIIPILIVLFVLTFGFSSILLHFGIFVEDLSNIIQIVLKLVFYLSGIFYSIPNRIEGIYGQLLLHGNPVAFLINESRNALMYGKILDYKVLLFWFIVGCLLSLIGIKVIYKYENSYAKVI